MSINRKAVLAAAIAVAVLVAAGIFYYRSVQNKNKGEEVVENDVPATPEDPSSSSTPPKKPAVSGDAPLKPRLVNDVTAPSLTYTQAVAIFANTLITFNEDCKMVPNPILVKSGTTLMFDNRSRDARVFKLEGTRYTIPGYGFKLFQLRSTKLPHVVKVECGPNSGEITLQ